MVSFSINGILQAEYKYDFAGRQVIRKLTQQGVTIHSVFDSEGNRIAEYNEATGALIREYVWLDGMPIAVMEGGAVYYIRTDHIGRPVFATDATGVKVWTATYLPFGGVRTTTGAPIDLRFPGQWFQSESGLHQNWMRDYDPTTGRYIEADPLGLVDGASIYGYARQSPGRYSDVTGQCPVCAAIVLGAAIGAGIDLVAQLYANDGKFYCVNWWEVGEQAAIGAAFGAAGEAYNAYRAAKAARDAATAYEIGILRAAARGKGNFGLGQAGVSDAQRLGEAWVGNGYKIASDGKTLLSRDGLRQYRPPTYKPRLGQSQANFESRFESGGAWQGNGHLDIFP